jgi:hypothetical protein
LATLEAFRRNISALDLDEYIDLRVGTSTAVAAIWPARPIDILLIDGDHSFLGTFRDFEAWAPKVRPGGIVIIDDLRSFPSLSLFMRIMEACKSIEAIEEYDELSIFHLRHAGDDLIDDLREAARTHSILRPWDYGIVHATPVAAPFEKTGGWRDPALHSAYFLSYLNVAGDGAYGVTDRCDEELATAISGAQRDRGAGDFVRITEEGRTTRGFRVIGCNLAEAPEMVARLKPGGVLFVRLSADGESELDGIRTKLEDLGLDGVGWTGTEQVLIWGVGKIDALSDEIVIARHIENRN